MKFFYGQCYTLLFLVCFLLSVAFVSVSIKIFFAVLDLWLPVHPLPSMLILAGSL